MSFQITNTIVNMSNDGAQGIVNHACTSTDGLIAWVITMSIWLIILFLVMTTDERKWAIGAASFVGFIFATAFLIFSCGAEALFIFMIVLLVLGLAGGFISS